MALYRWDVVRKSDGKITHSVVRDIEPPRHKDWGDPSTYDFVKSEDLSADIDYMEKKQKFDREIQKVSSDILGEMLKFLKGDQAALQKADKLYSDIVAAHPVPEKPVKEDKKNG